MYKSQNSVTLDMAQVVAYSDIALEKFTGLDSSEDAQTIIDLIERKIRFSLGLGPDDAHLFEHRRKQLFGSVLRGPAQDWFGGLNAVIVWNDLKTQFIHRFTDGKDKYLQQIQAESAKRQDNEAINGIIYRVTSAVDKGRSHLEADERAQKYKDFFLRGLAPAARKQNAYRHLIENPAITWQALKDHVKIKELSYSMSTSMIGVQSGTSDSRLAKVEEQSKKMTELLQTNKINATYNPNDTRMRQNNTRFCKHCKEINRTIKNCDKLKIKKQDRSQRSPQYSEKYSDRYPSRRPRDRSPSNNYQSANRSRNSLPSRDDSRRQNSPYDRRSQNTNYRDRDRGGSSSDTRRRQ